MKAEKTYSGRYHRHPVLIGMWTAWDLNGNRQNFTDKDSAISHSKSGLPLDEYKGFHYCYPGLIFKNGVRIFTNQIFDSFQQAKAFIDISIKATEQMQYESDRYGSGGNFADEAAEDAQAERFSQWMAEEAEQQLIEHEK